MVPNIEKDSILLLGIVFYRRSIILLGSTGFPISGVPTIKIIAFGIHIGVPLVWETAKVLSTSGCTSKRVYRMVW